MTVQGALLKEASAPTESVESISIRKPSERRHADRVSLLKPVPYTLSSLIEQKTEHGPMSDVKTRDGTALGVNAGPGGLLLLMTNPVSADQVLRIQVPTSLPLLRTPTLVDVRWTKKLPLDRARAVFLVGVRFLL